MRRVEIPLIVRHRQYGKTIRRKTVCHVHDENNESAVGDRVRIEESAPISKLKRWRLIEVLEKSKAVDVTALRLARAQKYEAGDVTMGELNNANEQPSQQ